MRDHLGQNVLFIKTDARHCSQPFINVTQPDQHNKAMT